MDKTNNASVQSENITRKILFKKKFPQNPLEICNFYCYLYLY